jgi:2-isopropylmalate synthase
LPKPTPTTDRDESERDMSDQVMIFDTTLRDGEQSPGISLDVGEKLEIADQLARLGVDVIEAGFPIASQGDFDAVEAIAKAVRGPVIAGLSRTGFKDVDRAWEAVRHAEQPRIHVFIATSAIHMKKKLRMTEEQVKEEAARAVARAKSYCADVEFSPEDGSRSDVDFMCKVLQIAVDNGATTLNIPDTVGFGVPEEYGKLIRHVIDNVRGAYVVSTHCHDDLGLAVANSLAGVAAGARQVECAINGLGERAGNAALEEVALAFGHVARGETKIDLTRLTALSKMVAAAARRRIGRAKAVVGADVFTHESGIHVAALMKDARTYQGIDPARLGRRKKIVIAKHSGAAAIQGKCAELGVEIDRNAADRLLAQVKRRAGEKRSPITRGEIIRLLDDATLVGRAS